jgi:hypothetical protein
LTDDPLPAEAEPPANAKPRKSGKKRRKKAISPQIVTTVHVTHNAPATSADGERHQASVRQPHRGWAIAAATATVLGTAVAVFALVLDERSNPDTPRNLEPSLSASVDPTDGGSPPALVTQNSPEASSTVDGRLSVSPSAANPTPSSSPVSNPKPPAGRQMRVEEHTWVDFDTATPATQGVRFDEDPPPQVDVQVGPDNAYPHNASRIWQTDGSGTCAAQASSNGGKGLQQQVNFAELLEARAGSFVEVCVVTTTKRVGTLRVSSAKGDRFAPYLIEYTFVAV